MHFVWPQALWALLLAPLLLAFYLWLLRRKQRSALAYPSLSLVRVAMGPRKLWRRHVPPALLGLALISAVVGMTPWRDDPVWADSEAAAVADTVLRGLKPWLAPEFSKYLPASLRPG